MSEKDYLIGTAEYSANFWDVMRGDRYAADKIYGGYDIATGGYALPASGDDKLRKAIRRESLFRNMATVVKAYNGASRIFAKDCADLAEWVPENGSIPIREGKNDFTRYTVDMHKLAVFVKLDADFVHDAAFSIEDYLTGRLAKNFARAEDKGFITGTGDDMPVGILDSAEAGVTTDALTYDDMVKLYFSVKPEYRKHSTWLMNDETALALRSLKDNAGQPVWNHTNDTILGHTVCISEFMPGAASGGKPIVFGDFSYYWIIDRSPVSVRTLLEEFVALDQIGYLAMEFLDGKLIRPEAVKALQMAE